MPIRITQHRATTNNHGLKVRLYENSRGTRFVRAAFYELRDYGILTTWNKTELHDPVEVESEVEYTEYVRDMEVALEEHERRSDHDASLAGRWQTLLEMLGLRGY
jgi:hypothetical protein